MSTDSPGLDRLREMVASASQEQITHSKPFHTTSDVRCPVCWYLAARMSLQEMDRSGNG